MPSDECCLLQNKILLVGHFFKHNHCVHSCYTERLCFCTTLNLYPYSLHLILSQISLLVVNVLNRCYATVPLSPLVLLYMCRWTMECPTTPRPLVCGLPQMSEMWLHNCLLRQTTILWNRNMCSLHNVKLVKGSMKHPLPNVRPK